MRTLINWLYVDMTDYQAIPWKRISVEVAAIVASILLAFAIDAWWAEVQERDFEKQTLAALLEEFDDHRKELEGTRRGHSGMLNAVGGLVLYAKTGTRASGQGSIDQSLSFLTVPWTTDFGNGVRDALISSGQLEVISDKTLRYEVAEWSSVLDELKDDQQHGVSLVFNLIIPYLTRKGVPFAEVEFSEQGAQIPSESRSLADDSETQKELFSDPEFLSILEIRHRFLKHTIGEIDDLIAATDSIIRKIETSLDE